MKRLSGRYVSSLDWIELVQENIAGREGGSGGTGRGYLGDERVVGKVLTERERERNTHTHKHRETETEKDRERQRGRDLGDERVVGKVLGDNHAVLLPPVDAQAHRLHACRAKSYNVYTWFQSKLLPVYSDITNKDRAVLWISLN